MAPPITQTGIRGFLLWFQREQPEIYKKIAPKLPAAAPKAFSNYTSRQHRLKQIYRTGLINRTRQQGMGDVYTLPVLYSTAPAVSNDPITVNYTATLAQQPVTYTAPVAVDYTANLNAAIAPLDVSGPNPVPIESSPIASAANTGASSTPIANAIAQTVGAASAIYLNNQQAQLQQQIVQSQLARAQAGLPPLNTSLNQLGVPTVTTTGGLSSLFSGSSGSLIVLIGAVLGVVLLTDKKKT